MSALDIERSWWGDCGNTFHEEQKQVVYARRMGLSPDWSVGHPPQFDIANRRIVDFGGGPVSILLKCVPRAPGCMVVDPCLYPTWVTHRYLACGIEHEIARGEDIAGVRYDEAWCYNVLQHVDDPALVVQRMREAAPVQRIFEWIDLPAYQGHPHALTRELLSVLFATGGQLAVGQIEDINENGAVGRAWYGVFGEEQS